MKKSSFVPLLVVSTILFIFAVMRFISAGTEARTSPMPMPAPAPAPQSPISQTKDVQPPTTLAAARPHPEANGILTPPDSVQLVPLKAEDTSDNDVIQFRKTTKELISKLPMIEKVRAANKGKTHDTPQEVLDMGDGQATVIEAMRGNSRLISDGVDFFKECATNESVVTAARAVCLRNFYVWTKRANMSDSISVPDRIANIAKSLPAE